MRHGLKGLVFALLFGMGMAVSTADASCKLGGCAPACGPVACAPAQPCYQMVEKTIMVPETVTEMRKVKYVICKPVVQQKQITVTRQVPVVKEIVQHYTVMVQECRTKQVEYVVCKPVVTEVEKTCTVLIPVTEKRQGVRKVCQTVQVPGTQKVCKDQGHWEERPCAAPCGGYVGHCGHGCCGCGPAPCAPACAPCVTKVWVPQIVEVEVPVTLCKQVVVDEPYEYCVTVCKPEVRAYKVKVCSVIHEKMVKDVQYTVCVPTTHEKKCQVTTYECVSEPKVIDVTVMVQECVEKEVPVQVCRMVPKTIQVQVPVCAPSCCAPSCCH